jgi:hypothetical protein
MNKKRLLVVMLIVLALGIFVSCEESMSVSLKGTWKSVETEEGVTTTIIMVFQDSSYTMDVTAEGSGISVVTKGSGTYTKTDSTITTTLTSVTVLGTTYTGTDLATFVGSSNLTETVDYSITKSGSTVTLNVEGSTFVKQ